jgi:hypothetical protein
MPEQRGEEARDCEKSSEVSYNQRKGFLKKYSGHYQVVKNEYFMIGEGGGESKKNRNFVFVVSFREK